MPEEREEITIIGRLVDSGIDEHKGWMAHVLKIVPLDGGDKMFQDVQDLQVWAWAARNVQITIQLEK